MPPGPNAVTELRLLAVAVVIGLVQLMWEAAASQRQRGYAWAAGPRDEKREVTGVAARLQRAMQNYLETFGMFAAALLAAVLLGRTGPLSLLGAWLYVIGRAVYVPLYAAGVPLVRSLAWGVAVFGIVLELVSVL
jgi:uncharacterized MAPEG superfamily protein